MSTFVFLCGFFSPSVCMCVSVTHQCLLCPIEQLPPTTTDRTEVPPTAGALLDSPKRRPKPKHPRSDLTLTASLWLRCSHSCRFKTCRTVNTRDFLHIQYISTVHLLIPFGKRIPLLQSRTLSASVKKINIWKLFVFIPSTICLSSKFQRRCWHSLRNPKRFFLLFHQNTEEKTRLQGIRGSYML